MFSYIFLAFFVSSPVLTANPEQLNFCSKNQWRCRDGSCIPFDAQCDDVVDCPDGSDETHALCRHVRASKCVLPKYPDHGTYSIVGRVGARPGLILDAVSLSVSCDPPYRPDGPADDVHCYNGQWYSPVPQCTRFCQLTPHPSVTYSCKPTDPNILSGDRKCNDYEPSGTEVHPSCNDNYHHNGVLSYMYCIDGTWDHVATCEPVCGILTPNGEPLVINGVSAMRGELPWHAGIYDKRYTPFMQICGGSLASTTVIITVAHCFWNDVERVLPAKYFAVGVGKIFRPWNKEEGGQKSDVADIKVPPRFLGAGNNFQDDIALLILVTPIVLTNYVRPVCIDFNALFDERQLQPGNVGKVAGWGLTSENGNASQILKVTELPYVGVEQCIADLPFAYRSFITSDKICAGSKTGSALCKGDSGGGLVFPEVERSVQRWYLRGLVSTAPSNGHMCNAKSYTSFTQLLKHDNFVRKHLNNRASKCVLPPYPEHGTYSIVREGGKPGLVLDTVALIVSCDPPYRPDGPAEVRCLNGQWFSPIPQCKRFCKLTPHPSVRYSCKLTDPNILSRDQKCNDYEPSGTEVHPSCNDNYYHKGVLSYMYCIDGSWDHVATCESAVGDSCSHEGATGVCQLLRNCRAAVENPKLPRCGFEGFDEIICCVETSATPSAIPVATTPRPGTTTARVYDSGPNAPMVEGCAAGEADRTAAKTGRKAWDNIDNDPNRAPPCDASQCQLPDCFCSGDGTAIPGDLPSRDVPQMITITFNDAINSNNIKLYKEIFNGKRKNPNGCDIKATYFVSHKYTNYSAVQETHRKGHEIAVHSITHNDDERFWSNATVEEWSKEMAGMRVIIEKFSNITDNSVVGVRAPHLRVGGNNQFTMMEEQAFLYDSTITAPLSNPPLWPYTMYHRMPHCCHGNLQSCPTRSHAVWEMVINELDRREDPTNDDYLPGCAMVDSCSNILTGDQFYNFLNHNFDRHYDQNRAPLGLYFHAAWLKKNPEFLEAFLYWIDEVLSSHNDVYFVTMIQVIQWIQNPRTVSEAKNFEPWREKCAVEGNPACWVPHSCKLTSKEVPGETINLQTCVRCPVNYPWLNDPTGDGRY